MNPYRTESVAVSERKHTAKWFNRRAATIALLVHSGLVSCSAVLIFLGLEQSSEFAGLWMVWYIFDIPASIGLSYLETPLNEVMSFKAVYTIGFGLYFLVFGGLQYFLLVGLFSGVLGRLRDVASPLDATFVADNHADEREPI